ncbi:MAG: DUF2807 domain-containing protein [Legionellaceae bacterium]|nr:DUF2807 domain-containing protein [Legionellaceae bacterium]
MLNRVITLLVLSTFLMSCARFHHQPARPFHFLHSKSTHAPGNTPINQNVIVTSFNQVKIKGNFEVNLHTNSRQPTVIFHGDPRDLAHVKWFVTHNELMIEAEKDYPKYGHVYIDISSRYLRSFVYQGSGAIAGQYLYSKSLDLYIKNNGNTTLDGQLVLHRAAFGGKGYTKIKGIQTSAMQLSLSDNAHVQLSGVADVSTINMKGHSWLSLYWVKGNMLKLRLKESARVQLAGTVGFFDAALRDDARFNGRYLRARRAFVKTEDRSEADINVVEAQHTLATGTSNIYFYDLPDMKADFMAENGSVLDLREWERPFMKEPTRYNR